MHKLLWRKSATSRTFLLRCSNLIFPSSHLPLAFNFLFYFPPSLLCFYFPFLFAYIYIFLPFCCLFGIFNIFLLVTDRVLATCYGFQKAAHRILVLQGKAPELKGRGKAARGSMTQLLLDDNPTQWYYYFLL